jgi:hypothetical protein
MSAQDWLWLALTFAQVSGLGIALAALGFGYERAVSQGLGLIAVLERDALVRWLALGMAIFSLGLCLGEANLFQKFSALGLTVCLGWLAWRLRHVR